MAEVDTDKSAAAGSTRPTKPDEEAYKAEVEKAEKELAAAKKRLDAAKAKLDGVQGGNKDSPAGQKMTALRAEQADIRKQHQTRKDARNAGADQIKRLDEKMRSIMNEQKADRAKMPFKSIEELDQKVAALTKQVDTGTMKLVDERKALDDIKVLNRSRKGFEGLQQKQKQIDDLKAQIAEAKKSNDSPEAKALNDRYDEIQKVLNEHKKDSDAAYKNINALRDERTKAHAEQQEKWTKVREINDRYHTARRAWRDHENQQRQQRRERAIAEKQAYESGKRREIAQQKLEEASAPAYGEELHTAESLIRHFDPSAVAAKTDASQASKFAATASRTIDAEPPKGTRVASKKDNDEDYFAGSAGKKKKGKGGNAAAGAGGAGAPAKFNLSVDIIESLARLGIDPPVSQSHVPIVVTKLKEKIEHWKSDQERKTKENIAKAQKEIDKFEAESNPSAPANAESGAKDTHKKPAQANAGAGRKIDAEAELAQEQDAKKDAAVELEKAREEDASAPVGDGKEAAE